MSDVSQGEVPAVQDVLDTVQLRQLGTSPSTPFTVIANDGQPITVMRLLRVVPGKRLVAEGSRGGETVLVKLFFSRRARVHQHRELRGIRALQRAGIPTPDVIDSLSLEDGRARLLLSRFFATAEPVDVTRAPDTAGAERRLEQVFALAGQLHAAGLQHTDLHGGNFLNVGDSLYLLDGDAVDLVQPGKPLRGRQAFRNLATLVAVLPCLNQQLLDAYTFANPAYTPDRSKLEEAAYKIRGAGRVKAMEKSVRRSTQYAVVKNPRCFQVIRRHWRDALQEILGNPDTAMAGGRVLKNGRSSTVVAIDSPAGRAVVKRYNIKNPWHGLLRLLRPSRAWVAWRSARLLELAGLHTPEQLAMIEERVGPLRRRAWLITGCCPGTPLNEQLHRDRVPSPREGEALCELLATFWREHISHGDLKASNLLWHEDRLYIIDLDAVRRHRYRWTHRRAWRRDRQRLLDNWPRDSALYSWLDANLPTEPARPRAATVVAALSQLPWLGYSAMELVSPVTVVLY